MAGMSFTGLAGTIAALGDLATDVSAVFEDALEEVAHKILKEAKINVPVDTGFLRSSGKVERRRGVVIIKFTTDYAAAVHEDTDPDYQNGDAKYLKRAVNVVLSREDAASIIADRLTDAIL